MQRLTSLYRDRSGEMPERCDLLPLSGSARKYYRLSGSGGTVIGCIGTNPAENRAFLALDAQFRANGLHAPDHFTSAYDLALMARAYFSHDILAKIAGTARYHIEPTATQPDDIWMNSTNFFLNGELNLEGMVGGKTGYTSAARSCLVTCAERNGRKLICAIMREEPPTQYLDTATLMNYGAQSFRALYDTASIGGYQAATGELFSISSSLPIILPAVAEDSEVEASVRYLAAPEAASPQESRKIGEIIYSFHGKELGSADLL